MSREAVERLKALFAEIPPRWAQIGDLFSRCEFTPEELAEAAVDVTDNCFDEYSQALDPSCPSVSVDRMHTPYVIPSLAILLEHGLDPNLVVDGENAMWNTQWINAPDICAGALRLLLESGGDPNLVLDGESLFECVTYKVSEDDHDRDYFCLLQCWLVLMGFGGCWSSGAIPVRMLNGNDVRIFRNYELFDFRIERPISENGKRSRWIMHIINRETGEEVAIDE
jgi:hypothetical protein